MGLGKEQPTDSKILTSSGWKRMGDIKVGSFVIGADGTPKRVKGAYPQGLKDIYKVKFNDGSSVECGYDHLWAVSTPERIYRGCKYKILSTSKLIPNLKYKSGNNKWAIPIVRPVQFRQQKVPLNPYLMGYLLANGCFTNNNPTVSIPDKETLTILKEFLPKGVYLDYVGSGIDYRITTRRKGSSNEITSILRNLGLMGSHANDKFFPKVYLINSIDIRHKLLQGYMDGDGWVTNKGNVLGVCSASKKLTDGALFLIRSLGGTAKRLNKKSPKFTYKGESKIGRPSYGLTICIPNCFAPFQLSRKSNEYKGRVKYKPNRYITSIKKVGKKQCQCISVDSEDGLYVTDSFVVTHNTIQVISWWNSNPHVSPVIVVCPAFLKDNWEREVMIHAKTRCKIIKGRRASRVRPMIPYKVLIINYDILHHWVKYLIKLHPQLVVIDEGHNIKNMETQRCKATFALCKSVPHVICTTGTPLLSRPAELWPLIHVTRPRLFPAFWDFGVKYCRPRRNRGKWEYKGADNLEELHAKLFHKEKGCVIRRLKKDVLKDLPEKARQIIPISCKLKEYNDFDNSFKRQLAARKRGIKDERTIKQQAWTHIGELKRRAARAKLQFVMEWIDNFLESTDEKIILFAIHKRIIKELKDRYGRAAVVIDGSTPNTRRRANLEDFNKRKGCRILIGQNKTCGSGWNGTAASTVGIIELCWTPGENDQLEDRIHRIGQFKKCIINYFIAKDTIEEKICALLDRKRGVSEEILDGGKISDFNMSDKLMEEYLKIARRKAA